MNMEPGVFVQVVPNALGPMGKPPVPEQHNMSPQLMQEVVKKLHHLYRANILVRVESAVEPKAPGLRRDHNGGNGGDFGP